MRRQLVAVALVAGACIAGMGEGRAYTYASPGSDPLIKGREAFLSAVTTGDWSAVETAYTAFKPDIAQLEAEDVGYAGDPGLGKAFSDAISAKDAEAAKTTLRRAIVDQIDRRLSGAEANVTTYQTCSTLVVTAQAFYQAMAGDLPPDAQKSVSVEMQTALDACGKPGVFGYGSKPADPDALKAAAAAILTSLKGSAPSNGSAPAAGSSSAPAPGPSGSTGSSQ